jgi:uncharacterized DUF497 family protein
MEFEWDPGKAAANLDKHGVDFADAALVFYDPLAITLEDDDTDEERFVTIGIDPFHRVLVVVYTWREGDIRLISARLASPRERRHYEGDQ